MDSIVGTTSYPDSLASALNYHPAMLIADGVEALEEQLRRFDIVPVESSLATEKGSDDVVRAVASTASPYFVLELQDSDHPERYVMAVGSIPSLVFNGPTYKNDSSAEHPAQFDSTALDAMIDGRQVAPLTGAALPFSGGAVGFLTYESCIPSHLRKPAHPTMQEIPLWWFGRFDTVAIVDSEDAGKVRVISWIDKSDGISSSDAFEAARRSHADIGNKLGRTSEPPNHAPPTTTLSGNFEPGDSEWLEQVNRSQSRIRNGELDQVNIARRMTLLGDPDPIAIFSSLRRQSRTSFMYVLSTPECVLIGASPSGIVETTTDRRVIARPIAGTRRRTGDDVEDRRIAIELGADSKELAEHDDVVDVARMSLSMIAEPASIEIERPKEVHFAGPLMHMVSTVTGRLRNGSSPFRALQTCSPVGAVTGSPTAAAIKVISDEESAARGAYAGSIAGVGFDGAMKSAAIIRTVVLTEHNIHIQAAAGIVKESIPEKELQEVAGKATGPLQALSEAGLNIKNELLIT